MGTKCLIDDLGLLMMLKVQTKLRELTSGFYAYSPLFFASHSNFTFLPGFQCAAFAYLLNIITKLKALYMLFSFSQIFIVGFPDHINISNC